jgi:hypothetical protein
VANAPAANDSVGTTSSAKRHRKNAASFSIKRTAHQRYSTPMPLGPGPTKVNNDIRKRQGQKSGHKNEAERIADLKADNYCTIISPIKVRCLNCEQEIRLDRRSRYYPGLWEKHRDKCLVSPTRIACSGFV